MKAHHIIISEKAERFFYRLDFGKNGRVVYDFTINFIK